MPINFMSTLFFLWFTGYSLLDSHYELSAGMILVGEIKFIEICELMLLQEWLMVN